MQEQSNPSGRSPRLELHGTRPTPLRVHKHSHKIRKTPAAPPPPPAQPQAPPRPPVIIYTVSPKIIHANPNEFKSLVQRLTGANSSSTHTNDTSPSTAPSSSAFQENNSAVSPAARLTSMVKARSPEGSWRPQVLDHDMEMMEGIEIGNEIQPTGNSPGILSPNPNALQPIPPNFFWSDTNPNFNSNYSNLSNLDNILMMPNPSTNFASPQSTNMPSPNTSDYFSGLFDL